MKILKISALALLFSALSSCEKDLPQTDETKSMENEIGITALSIEACGDVQEQTLYAGQNIDAGTVIVSNDANNLYVTYTTNSGWEMIETHLYVGNCNEIPTNGGGNPQIGLFPYTTDHNPSVTSYTYTIPLSELDDCYCVAAHTALVQYDENGEIIASETGWADGNEMGGGSWAMSFEYCTQDCENDNNDETCYQEETAWADGDTYVDQGNWATYVAYNGSATTQTLYAGQTLDAGTVSISAPDANGDVTITITLNAGWSLQNVNEGIKIQGYDTQPTGNPSPGSFTTYKGNDLTVVVPASNYYGIHADVQLEVDCE